MLIDVDHELLNVFNGANESPLFLAVEGVFLDIAEHIIKKCRFSCPASCSGSNGMNALHAAVIRTHHDIFFLSLVQEISLHPFVF